MSAVAFSTLQYAKKLIQAGFTENQAEIQVEAMTDLLDTNVASREDIQLLKQDVKQVRQDLKQDINQVQQELKQDINQVEQTLKQDISLTRHEIKELESRMMIRLTGIMILVVGLFSNLPKILS